MHGAQFSLAKIERGEFAEADCQRSSFKHAKLAYSDWSRADIRHADFSNADLTQSVLHRIQDDSCNWQGATLRKVDRTDKKLAFAEDWKPPVESRV